MKTRVIPFDDPLQELLQRPKRTLPKKSANLKLNPMDKIKAKEAKVALKEATKAHAQATKAVGKTAKALEKATAKAAKFVPAQ